jgi:SAM-dependent methyltransferase
MHSHHKKNTEFIPCPFCGNQDSKTWGEELGFKVVRCIDCQLLYVNPRLLNESIDAAVRTGIHGSDAEYLEVRSRYLSGKVRRYAGVFKRMFSDVWKRQLPISWLDVGAGYGETLDAILSLAPAGSRVEGIEPMRPKAEVARARGLNITEDYLRAGLEKVDFISVVDVFSHIPDFHAFLRDVVLTLQPGGEIFVETGNLADLESREQFPGELGLPDHLVFAGEKLLIAYLERAGFDVVKLERERIDGFVNLGKNIVKKFIGRPASIGIPYTSAYRQVMIRARLRIAD